MEIVRAEDCSRPAARVVANRDQLGEPDAGGPHRREDVRVATLVERARPTGLVQL